VQSRAKKGDHWEGPDQEEVQRQRSNTGKGEGNIERKKERNQMGTDITHGTRQKVLSVLLKRKWTQRGDRGVWGAIDKKKELTGSKFP